jgi:uncharacterized protein YicC (UPF0701 family)
MGSNDAAYPSYFFPEQYNPEFGLTKRELIAAMAMQGLLATPGEYEHAKTIAQWAVDQADALIERLNADPVAEGVNLLPMCSRELDEGLTDGK